MSSTIRFDLVREALALSDEHEIWRADFDRSERALPAVREWLSREACLRESAAAAGLSEEAAACAAQHAPLFRENPALLRLLADAHDRLFNRPEEPAPSDACLPLLPESLGAAADLFYLFVFLSGVPQLQEKHRKRGIPPSITRETLCDLQVRLDDYRRRKGRWGLDVRAWFTNHFSGRLIGLGRLQFQLNQFGLRFKVYVHGGEAVALALGDETFRANGQFASADGGENPGETWQSILEEDGPVIRGHRADPQTGAVERTLTTLDRSLWKEALVPFDPVLAIHIPASGPLDPEACRASLGRVEAFFSAHYADRPFKAISCVTWMLDPQLAGRLGPGSNIVGFQRLFRPLPFQNGTDNQFFERIFGGRRVPLDQLPADNSLRRAIIAHLREGKRWRVAGAFILREHLPR